MKKYFAHIAVGILMILVLPLPAVADALSRAEGEYNIAVGYYNRGDFLYAIEQIDRYLEEFPEDIHHADAWYLKAESFYQTKDYESALAAYRRLVEFDQSWDLVINPALYQLYRLADFFRWQILHAKAKLTR